MGGSGSVLNPVREFVAGRRRFLLSEAAQATGLDRRKVLRVLEKFKREGYLRLVKEETIPRTGYREMGKDLRNPRFEVVKDIACHPGLKRQSGRDKMWRTIRVKRRFTRADLIILTGCGQSAVEDYTRLLERDGWIRKAGKRGREVLYLLPKDPGPVRPETPENNQ